MASSLPQLGRPRRGSPRVRPLDVGRGSLQGKEDTAELDATIYAGILTKLKEQGYPLDRLQKTPQPIAAASPGT